MIIIGDKNTQKKKQRQDFFPNFISKKFYTKILIRIVKNEEYKYLAAMQEQ